MKKRMASPTLECWRNAIVPLYGWSRVVGCGYSNHFVVETKEPRIEESDYSECVEDQTELR